MRSLPAALLAFLAACQPDWSGAYLVDEVSQDHCQTGISTGDTLVATPETEEMDVASIELLGERWSCPVAEDGGFSCAAQLVDGVTRGLSGAFVAGESLDLVYTAATASESCETALAASWDEKIPLLAHTRPGGIDPQALGTTTE